MDVNTKEQATAVLTLSKIERIRKVESQIRRTSFVPALTFAVVLGLLFIYKVILGLNIDAWTGVLITSSHILSVGQALIKRADLQYQLIELKHGL